MQPRLYWTCPFYGLFDKKTNVSEIHALHSGNMIWCPNSTDSLCSKLATPGLMGTQAGQENVPWELLRVQCDSSCVRSTQTHHNNKWVITVEFTCATGKSSTRSTHYHTQGCEVSPYEGAINGPSSPTFLCTSCLPFLFHPFRGLRPQLIQEAYKTVNLMNGNLIPILYPRGDPAQHMLWYEVHPRGTPRMTITYADCYNCETY